MWCSVWADMEVKGPQYNKQSFNLRENTTLDINI